MKQGDNLHRTDKKLYVIPSDCRSTRLIEGAWVGIYHWSETEGKHWNPDIRQMTDGQWKELVNAKHAAGMDMIVIREVFRNQEYVG